MGIGNSTGRLAAHSPVTGSEPWYWRQSHGSPCQSRSMVILCSDFRSTGLR